MDVHVLTYVRTVPCKTFYHCIYMGPPVDRYISFSQHVHLEINPCGCSRQEAKLQPLYCARVRRTEDASIHDLTLDRVSVHYDGYYSGGVASCLGTTAQCSFNPQPILHFRQQATIRRLDHVVSRRKIMRCRINQEEEGLFV